MFAWCHPGRCLVLVLALLGGAMAIAPLTAATPPPWQAHDPHSAREVDHGAWEQFILRHLRIGPDGVHRIAYGRVGAADREALAAYVERLALTPLADLGRDEQLALWINLYNALVVQLVIEHYPVGSILDIGADGPWTLELIEVDGVPLSLEAIAEDILEPIWNDPRVHYALACGAIGCPNLQPEPYRGSEIEQQLTRAAMTYINDSRCILIDDRRLVVSSLFRWRRDHFGGSDAAVIRHLMAFAEPELAMALQKFDRIHGEMFDWRLNDATLL